MTASIQSARGIMTKLPIAVHGDLALDSCPVLTEERTVGMRDTMGIARVPPSAHDTGGVVAPVWGYDVAVHHVNCIRYLYNSQQNKLHCMGYVWI